MTTATPFPGRPRLRMAAMTVILGCVSLVLTTPDARGQADGKTAGRVVVTSKPADLEFEILNADRASVGRGLTPATVDGLAAGTYKVIVRQSGSVAQRYAIKVEEKPATLEADFSLQDEWQKLRQDAEAQQEKVVLAAHALIDFGPKLLRDLAVESLRDEGVKELLAKHGYRVAPPQKPEPAEAAPRPAEEGVKALAAGAPDLRALPSLPEELAERDWDAETEAKWLEQIGRLRKAKEDRNRLVESATAMEPKLQSLVMDLLILGSKSDNAAQIVKKHRLNEARAMPVE